MASFRGKWLKLSISCIFSGMVYNSMSLFVRYDLGIGRAIWIIFDAIIMATTDIYLHVFRLHELRCVVIQPHQRCSTIRIRSQHYWSLYSSITVSISRDIPSCYFPQSTQRSGTPKIGRIQFTRIVRKQCPKHTREYQN